jgi:hypothetical protein
MANNLKMYGAIAVVVCGAFFVGRVSGPARVETKEVEKIVYRERSDEKKDVTTSMRVKEITMPNGEVVKETIVDTHESSDKSVAIDLHKDTEKQTITNNQPDWFLSLTYEPPLIGWQSEQYTMTLSRRLFSTIYVGASASTDRSIGVTIGIGF